MAGRRFTRLSSKVVFVFALPSSQFFCEPHRWPQEQRIHRTVHRLRTGFINVSTPPPLLFLLFLIIFHSFIAVSSDWVRCLSQLMAGSHHFGIPVGFRRNGPKKESLRSYSEPSEKMQVRGLTTRCRDQRMCPKEWSSKELELQLPASFSCFCFSLRPASKGFQPSTKGARPGMPLALRLVEKKLLSHTVTTSKKLWRSPLCLQPDNKL
jgi:hypothetical protein